MVAKTKPWRKSLSKRETWKNGHSYNVIRSAEGTFVKVHKIRAYHYREAPKKRGISYKKLLPIGKALSIYGKARTRKGTIESRRWELVKGNASTDEWRGAVGIARERPPRKEFSHRRTYAKEMDVEEFSTEDEWVDAPEIESR